MRPSFCFARRSLTTAHMIAGAALLLRAPACAAILSFPWVELSPQAPTSNDSVSLRVVLGHSDSTCAPSYTGLSHTVSPESSVAGLPGYCVRLSYAAGGSPCGLGSRLHGPAFQLGTLPRGQYRIADSVTGLDLGTFRVVAPDEPVYTLAGTVVDAGSAREAIAGALVVVQEPAVPYFPLSASNGEPAAPLTYRFVGMTRSDATGRFAVGNLPDGIYGVSATAQRHDSVGLQVRLDRDVSVTLALNADGSVGSVAGMVRVSACPLDTSCGFIPVPGCSVWVSLTAIDTPQAWLVPSPPPVDRLALADSLGFFQLDSLPATPAHPLTITASAPDMVWQSLEIRVLPSRTTRVLFTLERQFAPSPSVATVTRDSVDYTLSANMPDFVAVKHLDVQYTVRNRSGRALTLDIDSACLERRGPIEFGLMILSPQRNTLVRYGPHCSSPVSFPATVPACSSMSLDEMDVPADVLPDTFVIRAWLPGHSDSTAVELPFRSRLANAARHIPRPVAGSQALLRGTRLELHLLQPRRVTVERFTVDGRAMAPPLVLKLAAGSHALSVPLLGRAAGVSVVRVSGLDLRFEGVVTSR